MHIGSILVNTHTGCGVINTFLLKDEFCTYTTVDHKYNKFY